MRVIKTVLPALKNMLFRRSILVSCIIALAFGLTLPYGLSTVLPPAEPLMPFTVLASSFVIDLGALSFLLCCLPSSASEVIAWSRVGAFLASIFVCGFAFVGLALSGAHAESAQTFVTLWLVFAAQAAVLGAIHSLLRLVTNSNAIASQLTLLLAALVVTALFWSRESIQKLSHSERNEATVGMRLADGVMKLSPPPVIASAWYRESSAARAPHGSGDHRFDLVRAPLAYEIWIGSYQAIPYPAIFPSTSPGDGFQPGIILAMLVWGLPLLIFCDVLLLRSLSNGATI
jgi:hypothetical protein